MRNHTVFLLIAFLAVVLSASQPTSTSSAQGQEAQVSGADDLHLRGKVMVSFQDSDGQHILAFTEGFELSIGDNLLKSKQAVVWLDSQTTEYQGVTSTEYKAKVYLEGDVSVEKGAGAKTTDIDVAKKITSGAGSMVAEFKVSGEVFATAENRIEQDVRDSQLYKNGLIATGQVKIAPVEKPEIATEPNEEEQTVVQETQAPAAEQTVQAAVEPNEEKPAAAVPSEIAAEPNEEKQTAVQETGAPVAEQTVQAAVEPNEEKSAAAVKQEKPAVGKVKKPAAEKPVKKEPAAKEPVVKKPAVKEPNAVKTKQQGIFGGFFGKGPKKQAEEARQAQPALRPKAPPAPPPKFQYPVNISGLGTEPVRITNENLPDGTSIATILNRFYLWQKQDEQGNLLEFQANSAVVFYSRGSVGEQNGVDGILAGNTVKAIYLRGDIIMTEGQRTVRADEAYYDFEKKQGLAVNAVMRNYDPLRGIPIYVRADKLRQLSENKFKGENVVLTNSEFYMPRLAMTASEMVVTDTTTVDEQTGKLGDHSYYGVMKNVKLKLDNRTIFWWPQFSTNLQRSDTALRSAHVSHDGTFGTSVETEWYLARILGLREPAGVDSSLLLDYYSKRGFGLGIDIDYKRDDYFGKLRGYVINDHGKDDLGRDRKNLEPPNELRGRFKWQHRQFLPDHWQLSLEASYLSDEHYLESFHRDEFLTDKEQETLIHLKRIQDNWGFAILGKWRINDFQDQLEELPSAQYHLEGQSLFNDKFTLYNDSSIGRYRQLIGKNHDLADAVASAAVPGFSRDFTFASTRTELDLPLQVGSGSTKVVPFVAGTFGYDDRIFSELGSKDVFIGEAGMRASTQFHKTNKDVHSRFWDINGIRHIVKPYVNASIFAENNEFVEEFASRDRANIGVLQRWLTKRGTGSRERTVEWMRLNVNYTWLNNEGVAPDLRRPDKFIWNDSMAPLSALSAPGILNGDLPDGRFELFGMQRSCVNADYIWRISDTTALLSDLNYDVKGNSIEQFDIGFSRLCWPNLSYYVGTRYLRSVETGDEKGSNAFTFAVTYKINPRYTITFANQYDFQRKEKIASEVTLIRRYHRLFYGLTYSLDESLDRQAIVLSIWPEGVSELSMGSRRYMGLDAPQERND